MSTLAQFITRYWLVLSAAILLAITCLSLWPLESLPQAPGTDKTHHVIAYAALAFPAALAKPTQWQWLMLGFFGYSGAIELMQPWVNRYGELWDLFANGCGLLVGILLAWMVSIAKQK